MNVEEQQQLRDIIRNTDFLENKVHAVRIVMALTGLTTIDARDLVQAAPRVVATEFCQLRTRLLALAPEGVQ